MQDPSSEEHSPRRVAPYDWPWSSFHRYVRLGEYSLDWGAADLKKIYQAVTVGEAEDALDDFAQAWDAKYPTIAKVWRAKWTDIITLFDFPPPIRRAIYTTNAIESVNSVIRKFTKNRKIYPNEQSALKLIYMAIHEASKKWTMPIHHWKPALNHFAILYEDRLPKMA
jgi:transposase-like protein